MSSERTSKDTLPSTVMVTTKDLPVPTRPKASTNSPTVNPTEELPSEFQSLASKEATREDSKTDVQLPMPTHTLSLQSSSRPPKRLLPTDLEFTKIKSLLSINLGYIRSD